MVLPTHALDGKIALVTGGSRGIGRAAAVAMAKIVAAAGVNYKTRGEEAEGRRMVQVAVNLSGDDGIDHYHPGHCSIIDSRGRIVALQPGEYVVDYLEPRMIHGQVIVQSPRRSTQSRQESGRAGECNHLRAGERASEDVSCKRSRRDAEG